MKALYQCPECHNIVELLDTTSNPPLDEHEFIYGRARCPKCSFEADWLSFGQPVDFKDSEPSKTSSY